MDINDTLINSSFAPVDKGTLQLVDLLQQIHKPPE